VLTWHKKFTANKEQRMTTKSAMFVFIVGLLITFGAVGGIEHSVTDSELMSSMLIAIVGLLSMYAGMLGLKNSSFYDRGY
jgi:hypothetical protein